MELVRGHHSVGEANLHLQFTAKYRRDVFRDVVVRRVCEDSFHEAADRLGIVIHALAFAPDHVHVFVGACRLHSVAELVRRLKGASSRRIRLACWDRISGKLWGKAFWSGGYFYRSVGSTTNKAIQYYVENSQSKHWHALDYEEYRHREAGRQSTLTKFIA